MYENGNIESAEIQEVAEPETENALESAETQEVAEPVEADSSNEEAESTEAESEPEQPPLSERMDVALRQIEWLAEKRGEHSACMEARHQLPWYLHAVPYAGIYRREMVHVESLADIRKIVASVKRDLK